MVEVWAILPGLGDKLAAHVVLSASAIGLAMLIALPLAVWAGRSQVVARVALSLASLVQTVPALALLALFFPLLLSLRAVFGEGLPTLGFLPALMALTLYALLPILRNAVTAQANLDPGVLEAADGVGMTRWQKLTLVEAPLAAPFIMAGIRTASVWTIGAATLATTIGQPSLGDPIFAGLQTQNWALVLAGCLVSAGLALAADWLLWWIEIGFERRARWMTFGGFAVVALGISAALWGQGTERGERPIVIAAKQFSEQYILAQAIGARLVVEGYRVEYRDGLGSAVVHSALASSSIDIAIDYTGTIWANFMKRSDNPGREVIYRTITEWEARENSVRVLGRLGFENAYAFAMREDRARALGVTSLADLVAVGPQLTVGGDPEFFERPEWIAVRDAYGLSFGRTRNFAPTFMYSALASGEADVISAYTSDGRIAADRLVVLADPKGALPSYETLLMLSPRIAEDEGVAAALRPMIGAISVEAMREANYAVDREDAGKLTPKQAAARLAKQAGF
jgi:osmoprotectant transport system permease protein